MDFFRKEYSMPQAPPVLRRLKALGLKQKEIAAKIGASPQAVSAWFQGKNPFEEPWNTDAHLLLAVLVEHLAQGEPAHTVAFSPRAFMNTGGTTVTGYTELHAEDVQELDKLRASLQGCSAETFVAAMEKFEARHTAAKVAERLNHDPLSWDPSAHELNTILRMTDAVRLCVTGLLREKAWAIMAEEDIRTAGKTP
jgi:transcriptional regulator with XRE-family HTH domain